MYVSAITAGDIDKLQRLQNRGARFITQDFKSRETGCVTEMQRKLNLISLQERRKHLRLTLMFKVVAGLVPALPSDHFFTPEKNKRKVQAKQFPDCAASNIVENSVRNNLKCFQVPSGTSEEFRYSFFHRTIIEWNHLDDAAVNITSPVAFLNHLNKTKTFTY